MYDPKLVLPRTLQRNFLIISKKISFFYGKSLGFFIKGEDEAPQNLFNSFEIEDLRKKLENSSFSVKCDFEMDDKRVLKLKKSN